MDMKAVDGHLFEIKESRKLSPQREFATAPLSAVIRLAIEDLKKIEALPRKYRVDMHVFHEPGKYPWSKCGVCLAGSVMAMRLGAPTSVEPFFEDFGAVIADRLEALNCARRGDFVDAADYFGYGPSRQVEVSKAFEGFFVTPYATDPDRFKLQMLAAADIYESLGL